VVTFTPTDNTIVCIELENRQDMWVIHNGPTVNLNELLSVGQKDLPKYICL